jgi:hypothetical protein
MLYRQYAHFQISQPSSNCSWYEFYVEVLNNKQVHYLSVYLCEHNIIIKKEKNIPLQELELANLTVI